MPIRRHFRLRLPQPEHEMALIHENGGLLFPDSSKMTPDLRKIG